MTMQFDWYIGNVDQAIIDEDGVFRAVVADVGPGVPNLIDTTQVVKFSDLRDHLPPSASVITPDGRAAIIFQGRRAVQRRFAA